MCLHTRQEKVLISDRLKICHMKMETAPMVRVHKSYVVNLKQVIKFEADKVILTDGIVIPIGRRYKKEAKSRFQKFIFN